MGLGSKTIELILSAKDRTAAALTGARKGLSGFTSKVFNAKTAIVALLGSLGAGAAFKGFVETVSDFEDLEASLVTVTGSLDGARKAMKFANDEAARSPYTVLEYANAIKTLAAYGLDYEANMRTLGDTAAAMGKPLQAAVEALADAVQGQGERLLEFGVRQSIAGNKITYTWVDTFGKVRKTIAENNPKIIEETLRGIWNEKYAGGMARFGNTWSGLTSTLKSLWDEFLVLIGKSGALDAAKAAVQKLLDVVNQMKQDGSFSAFAQSIGQGVGKVINWFADLIVGVGKIDAVLDIAAGSFGAFRDMVATIINQVSGFVLSGFSQIAGAIDKLTFGKIPGLSDITTSLEELATGARISAEETSKSWQENSDKVAKAWDTLTEKGKATKFDEVADGLNKTADAAQKTIEPVKNAANEIKKSGEKAKKAQEDTQKYLLELEKLASNEKIKAMELSVDLDIATIEADTERVIRSFDSIDSSIAGTQDRLTDMMGMFANLGGSVSDVLSGRRIMEQVERDNKRLDDQLELQKQTVEAQLKLTNARTEAFRSGDPLIVLDSSSLVPEADAFAMAILSNLKIRLSEDQAELLTAVT